MMNEVIASLPEFVAPDREIIRRVAAGDAVPARAATRIRRAPTRPIAPTTTRSVRSWSCRRPREILAAFQPFGQHAEPDTVMPKISLIDAVHDVREEGIYGTIERVLGQVFCCTSIDKPTIPSLISVTPQAR